MRRSPRTAPAVDPHTALDPRRWKALALLCTANFMVILDAQIVILALPSIAADLGLSPGEAQWVLSAYLLCFGGLLLLGGRAADLLGRRRIFVIGTALFLVSSLLCGLAWSPVVLVAARVVQGISAALMAPTALAILMTTFPEGVERNKALSVWSGTGGLGASAALLIGGGLTGTLGWPWIFFLNVPVALALLVASPLLLRESQQREAVRGYDPAGALTVTAALVLLINAVVRAPEEGWDSPVTLGMFAAAVVLFATFVVIESRSSAPLVPLELVRSRLLVGGNVTMLLIGVLAFGTSLITSLYAQQVLAYSPIRFGLATVTMTAMAVVGAVLAQLMLPKVGLRPVAAGAIAAMLAGCAVLTQLSAGGSYFGDLFLGLLLFGPGLGAGAVAATASALGAVPERQAGLASATVTAAFQIGGAVGAAIVSTIAAAYAVGGSAERLTEGFRTSFVACTGIAVLALVVAVVGLRPARQS